MKRGSSGNSGSRRRKSNMIKRPPLKALTNKENFKPEQGMNVLGSFAARKQLIGRRKTILPPTPTRTRRSWLAAACAPWFAARCAGCSFLPMSWARGDRYAVVVLSTSACYKVPL